VSSKESRTEGNNVGKSNCARKKTVVRDRHEISFDQGPESEDQTYLRITGSPFCCCWAIVGVCLGKCRTQRESCPEMLGRVIGWSAFAVAVVVSWKSRGVVRGWKDTVK